LRGLRGSASTLEDLFRCISTFHHLEIVKAVSFALETTEMGTKALSKANEEGIDGLLTPNGDGRTTAKKDLQKSLRKIYSKSANGAMNRLAGL